MKPLVFIIGFAALLTSSLFADDRRSLTAAELAQGLKAPGPAVVVDSGTVVDRMAVSPDGRWLVYTRFDDDLQNNLIRLVSLDGKGSRDLPAPRGYKNTPTFVDATHLFVSLDAPAASKGKDGLYLLPLEGKVEQWELFEAGSFRDLAVSDDGRFLAASTGNWSASVPRSTVLVWPLGPGGKKAAAGYPVATGVKGQVRQMAWAPSGASLVVEIHVDKAGDSWGVSNLYSAENKAGFAARLLRAGASSPVLKNQGPSSTVFFLEGNWERSRVLGLVAGEKSEFEVAVIDGLASNGLAWDRRSSRLLLGLQASATAASVVAFPPNR